MSEPTLIPIDLIIRDARLQSRVDPVDPDVAERYTTLYADGPTAMDAIEVYREAGAAREGQVWLTDGWTRLAAAERAGLREILATIKAGTWRDALLASWEANGRHGARLTRADQRRKAEAIMSDPELAGQPLRALEHRFGVGRELLRAVQAELEAAGRSVRPATVVDSAGREQPTKKPRGRPPGSKNRPKTAEEEGMRYARGLRTEARGLLEELRDRDAETWDLHGETQETSLWLEGLDDTSVTELEAALPVLRARVAEPTQPAAPAVVQQPTTTPPPVAEVEASPGAGDDEGDAEEDGPVADAPREPHPSKAEARPVRDLLCHLRDAGVERIGEGEEYSWGVRGVLDRLDLGDIKHRELVQISAAAERAALQLPQPAEVRRADGRARGQRIGRLMARLRQLGGEGQERVGHTKIGVLLECLPQLPDIRLDELERELFLGESAVAVGDAGDVAEMLNGLNIMAQVGGFREALERIEELEGELIKARAQIAELEEDVIELRRALSERAAAARSAERLAGLDGPALAAEEVARLAVPVAEQLRPYMEFVAGDMPALEIATMAGLEPEDVTAYREQHRERLDREWLTVEVGGGSVKGEIFQRVGDVVTVYLHRDYHPTSDRARLFSKASEHGDRYLWDIAVGPPPGLETHPGWSKVPEILRPFARLFGTMPDHEIAVKAGSPMTPTKVGKARLALGIAAFKAT